MTPTILTLIGIGLWAGVTVWDYRAKELTPALFLSRLLAPAVAALLCSVALYYIRSSH
jgi:hypothetical protein